MGNAPLYIIMAMGRDSDTNLILELGGLEDWWVGVGGGQRWRRPGRLKRVEWQLDVFFFFLLVRSKSIPLVFDSVGTICGPIQYCERRQTRPMCRLNWFPIRRERGKN